MRRTIVFLALLTAMVAQIAAQQVLYFHYKNGESFACEVDDISFITYDKSPGSADYDIQVIYFKDNTMQEIPFSKVDSVGFNAPAPVLKKDAMVLDASYEDYIIKGDTLSFTMRKDTPADKRPKVGNVVGSTFDNEVFADGIIARVTVINETADGIEYTCEKAYVEDVYDEIFYYGYGEIHQEPDAEAQAAPERTKRNLEVDAGFDLWNFKRSHNSPQIILDDYTWQANSSFETSGRLKMYLFKPKGGDLYARFNLSSDLESKYALSASGRNGGVNVTPLIEMPLGIIATPIPVVFFKPTFEIGFYQESFAELRTTLKASLESEYELQLTLENGKWSAQTVRDSFEAEIDELSLSLNGWCGVGVEPKFFMSLCGTKTGVSLAMRGGIQLNANFVMDLADYLSDGSLYSSIKDSRLAVTLPVKGLMSAQVGLFKRAGGVDVTFFTLNKPLWEAYFLPNINYAHVDDLGSGGYHAVAAISPRDLLPWEKIDVGFGVFDNDNRLVEKTYLETYDNDNQPSMIETTFNLETGKKYTIAPLLKIFGYDVRADRSTAVSPGDAVDLGLSVKWSSTNLGADAIYKVGDAYYWGTLVPASNFGIRNPITMPFYRGEIPFEISGMSSYDPCAQWGEGWRLPTKAEWEELIEKCTLEAVDAIPRPGTDAEYITWGVKVTGPNGNHIYIPANVSHWTGTVLLEFGTEGNPNPVAAYFGTNVSQPDVNVGWYGGIEKRYLIRPVCTK